MRRIFTTIKNTAILAANAVKNTFINAAATVRRKKIEMTTAIREDFTPNNNLTVEQRERKVMRSVSRMATGIMAAYGNVLYGRYLLCGGRFFSRC